MLAPDGLDEITARFGDPTAPGFEAENIVLFPLPYQLIYGKAMVNRSRCHRLMVPVFTEVLAEIKREGLADKASHYAGIYEDRPIRGATKRLSTHAWGIAIDINPAENQLGTFGRMHPGIIAIFGRHGFTWGGLFNRRDPMHFQFCKGY